MTATANTGAPTVEGRPWVPGIALPVTCLIVDLAAGANALRLAPAALLSLAAIGIASFAISRNHRRGLAGLAALGPMWLASGATLMLGSGLAAIVGAGLLAAVLSGSLNVGAFPLLEWLLLGFGPLWVGIAWLAEARALTERQVAVFGSRTTGLAALAGVVLAAAIVYLAHLIDGSILLLLPRSALVVS
jgi:hypothetical protein